MQWIVSSLSPQKSIIKTENVHCITIHHYNVKSTQSNYDTSNSINWIKSIYMFTLVFMVYDMNTCTSTPVQV